MANDVEKSLFEVAVSIIGAGLFGLVGFVWKISHKMTQQEGEQNQIRREVDYLQKKVDQIRESKK